MLISLKSVFTSVVLIALGFFLNEKRYFSKNFIYDISKFIINISLPAMIFVSVTRTLNIEIFNKAPFQLILYPAVSMLINYILSFIIMKNIKVAAGRRGTFINTIVNANIILIGLTVNETILGEVAMPYFLMYYLVNTISMWYIGSFIIATDKIHDENPKKNIKIMLPTLISLFIALIVSILNIHISDFIRQPLGILGNVTVPFGYIYIGIILSRAGLKNINLDKDVIVAILGRFFLSPFIMLSVITIGELLFGNKLEFYAEKTFIVQAVQPAFAIIPLLVGVSGGDEDYAANMILSTTMLFILIIPLIYIFVAV